MTQLTLSMVKERSSIRVLETAKLALQWAESLEAYCNRSFGTMRDSNGVWEYVENHYASLKGGEFGGRLYCDDHLGCVDGPMRWDIVKLFELPPKVLTPKGMMTKGQRAKARKARRALARKEAKLASKQSHNVIDMDEASRLAAEMVAAL